MAGDITDPRIGVILADRYRIIEHIGAGGMGVVYRGERIEIDKPVAVKFLQDLLSTDRHFLSRFKREARAMSKLAHPNCVSVIDFGVFGAPYIVMDYVHGLTLKEVLAVERLDIQLAIALSRQILAGIAHAHGQGIIHRDIKPENIMICQATGVGEHVRIFDFGLAKLLDVTKDTVQSMTSIVIGTPHYMSPEQSLGSKVDARTDVYSAAVVIFEMLSGRRLFHAHQPMAVIRMHRETPPPLLSEVKSPHLFSPALEAVIAKALAKFPDDRFQTANAFLDALLATPEGEQIDAARPVAFKGQHPQKNAALASDTTQLQRGTIQNAVSKLGQTVHRSLRLPVNRVRAVFISIAFVGIAVFLFFLNRLPRDATLEGLNNGLRATTEQMVTQPKTDSLPNPPNNSPAPESPDGSVQAQPQADPAPAVAGGRVTKVETIADARALADAGHREAAIDGLVKLRRKYPQNPFIAYLLGNLYFEKIWWADALDHYREAIRLNHVYRKKPTISRNAIEALGSDKTMRKARNLIVSAIGKAALPQLRQAAKKSESAKIRRRAASLVRMLNKKRRRPKKK